MGSCLRDLPVSHNIGKNVDFTSLITGSLPVSHEMMSRYPVNQLLSASHTAYTHFECPTVYLIFKPSSSGLVPVIYVRYLSRLFLNS